jgi:hypothetical protein
MRGERQLLRAGEYLVGRASRQLPRKVREERYREWAAELPAILHHPRIRFAPLRAIRMLAYAADTLRGATLTRARSRRRRHQLINGLMASVLLVMGLGSAVWSIWSIARSPAQPLNYLQLSWGVLMVAWSVSMRLHPAGRVTILIIICADLMGAVVILWTGAESQGEWVNYLVAAALISAPLALWPMSRWQRTRPGNAARKQV